MSQDPTRDALIDAALEYAERCNNANSDRLVEASVYYRRAHPTRAVEAEALTEARVREMIEESMARYAAAHERRHEIISRAIAADAKAHKGGAS